MKNVSLIIIVLLVVSCNRKSSTKTLTNFNDTTVLKSIQWRSLNAYVSYHIIKGGVETADTNIHDTLKLFAVYQQFGHRYDTTVQRETTHANPNELKKLIMSDIFSRKKSLDCLLKINSNIIYQYKSGLLKIITIIPKDATSKGVYSLTAKLKKEPFVDSITVKIERHRIDPSDKLTQIMKTGLKTNLRVKLKSSYWALPKPKDICSKLKEWPEIDNAIYVSMFTSPYETDMFWRLKSN
jgi:hypothetical protein